MHDIKSMTEKNAPASRAILMAMQLRHYGAERIAQYSRSRATLDATGRCYLAITYRPGRCHGHQFWHKKTGCGESVGLVPFSAKYLKFSRQRDPYRQTDSLTDTNTLAPHGLEEPFFQLCCCVVSVFGSGGK